MIYVWIQNPNDGVLLIRMLNGNLGLPFGFRLANETSEQGASRIAKCKVGVVIDQPLDTHEGVLYSDIEIEQPPSVEGAVVVSMFHIAGRTDIEPSHLELMAQAFMI